MNSIFLFGSTAASLGLSDSAKIMLWVGMAIYMVVLMGIGLWSGSKINDMKDFLVAGRRLPLWMATATLLATWFGAGSSMGVSATVFSEGIGGVIADPIGAGISLILAGIFIVGLLRKQKHLTVTDIISTKFGTGDLVRARRGRYSRVHVFVSLILSMLAGRAVWGVAQAVLLGLSDKPFGINAFLAGAFLNAIPGILLQLVLVPLVIELAERMHHYGKATCGGV